MTLMNNNLAPPYDELSLVLSILKQIELDRRYIHWAELLDALMGLFRACH